MYNYKKYYKKNYKNFFNFLKKNLKNLNNLYIMISFFANIYNYVFVSNQQNNEANVILIQSAYKMHKDRKRFNNMKNSVIKIQKCWRNYLQRSKVKKEDNISDISQNVKLENSKENNDEEICYKRRFNKKNKKNNKKNKKFNKRK